jgi:hypothetical protein
MRSPSRPFYSYPRPAEANTVVLEKGHFVATLCEAEEDEFWLCQLREDVANGLTDEDLIAITWLLEKTPGIYEPEQCVPHLRLPFASRLIQPPIRG